MQHKFAREVTAFWWLCAAYHRTHVSKQWDTATWLNLDMETSSVHTHSCSFRLTAMVQYWEWMWFCCTTCLSTLNKFPVNRLQFSHFLSFFTNSVLLMNANNPPPTNLNKEDFSCGPSSKYTVVEVFGWFLFLSCTSFH